MVGCSVETFGRLGSVMDGLLLELHGLAQRRQRERGINPTNWLLRWRTSLSVHLAINAGRAIYGSVSCQDKVNLLHLCFSHPVDPFLDTARPGMDENYQCFPCGIREEYPYPGGGQLNTLTSEVMLGGQGL